MDFFYDVFVANFQGCVWLACILISMIPLLEAKIAIPFAMNPAFFGENALSGVGAYFCALLGSILPSIFIILLLRLIKSKTSVWCVSNKKFAVKVNKINAQTSTLKKYVLLASFVAIPLPLTGVWTGSVIAGLGNLNIWKSLLAICIGAAISCAIMTVLCCLFSTSIGYILTVSLCMIVLFLIADIVISLIKKHHK